MTRPYLFILLLTLSMLLNTACSDKSQPSVATTPSPQPTPCFGPTLRVIPCDRLEQSLDAEMSDHIQDTLPLRVKVRQTVLDYLKTEHPAWELNGMSLTRYDNDPGYYVGVDINDGGKAKLVQLKVWFLVKSDGHTYWKVGAP
ncbi:MAG: hypothetical protein ACMG6H_05755 [Acidobacteriota bacterium]